MGITIDQPGASERRGGIVADRRLWLNAAGDRLLEDGDEAAAQLLASRAGKLIDRGVVDRLGLVIDDDGRVIQAGKPKPPKRKAAKCEGCTPDADVQAAVEAARTEAAAEVEAAFRQSVVDAAEAHGLTIAEDADLIDGLIDAAHQAALADVDGTIDAQGASAAGDGTADADKAKEGEAVQADQKAGAQAPADDAKAKAPAADKARKPAADKQKKTGASK